MISPEQAFPFDPVEFFMTFSVANEEAKGAPVVPAKIMEEAGCNSSEMIHFAKAVARRYGKDRSKFDSFMIRWKAWSEYALSGELARLHPNANVDDLARCSIEVAAVCPVTTQGQLKREIFFGALKDKLSNS